ncbi:MAG: hypothetical protein E7Z73_08220, partial [Methanobrevibacter millerae]
MAKFQEDMIFKDVGEEDVEVLLEIANKKSKVKKIWTEELRQIDPSTYKPDLIIELDDENLVLEFQSTVADDTFSQRGHSYVAIIDQKKSNNKEVNLCVISTAEKSKIVSYYVNKLNTFRYEVFGNDLFDGEKIINEIEEKYKLKKIITPKESIYFSLAPIMTKNGDIEENIQRVLKILFTLDELHPSTKSLCYAVLWLLIDKFLGETPLKNLLLDKLGGKMSAVYDYGQRKEQNGIKKGMKEGMEKGMKEGMEKGMEK